MGVRCLRRIFRASRYRYLGDGDHFPRTAPWYSRASSLAMRWIYLGCGVRSGIDPAVGALCLQRGSYLAHYGMREYSITPILVFLSYEPFLIHLYSGPMPMILLCIAFVTACTRPLYSVKQSAIIRAGHLLTTAGIDGGLSFRISCG